MDTCDADPLFFVELIRRGNVKLLRKLLAKGCPVDVNVVRKWTVLHEAAYRNKLECMKVLISYGSSQINSTNLDKKTPLYLCAKKNHLECLEYLLSKGADPNICDNVGRSPLYLAVANDNVDTVLKLLENNAPVKDQELLKAVDRNHLGIIKVLLEHFDKTMTRSDIALLLNKSWQGMTALQIAVRSRNVDCLKMLLAAGADANVVPYSGGPPLFTALFYGYIEMVKILLPLTDLELMYRVNESRMDPLVMALRVDEDAAILKLFIQHGYPIDRYQKIMPTRTVFTMLFPSVISTLRASILTNAIFMETPKVFIDTILERQTDFNSPRFGEFPPLLAALSKNQLELASELIFRGACINFFLPTYPFNLSLFVTENLESLKFVLKVGAEVESLFSGVSIGFLSQLFSKADATIKLHLELVLCYSFYVSEKAILPQDFYALLSSKTQRIVSEIPTVRSLMELSRRTLRKSVLMAKDFLKDLEHLQGILPKTIIDFLLFNNMF